MSESTFRTKRQQVNEKAGGEKEEKSDHNVSKDLSPHEGVHRLGQPSQGDKATNPDGIIFFDSTI